MEQLIKNWFTSRGVDVQENIVSRLLIHAEMVFDGNKMFNLTGFKSLEDIVVNLELDSLLPFLGLDVPRGTKAADCGTGAGCPGIPFAVFFPEATVVMFDSSEKKCDFVGSVIDSLGIDNAEIACGRIEDLGRTEYRDSFDLVMSRAMAPHYVTLEVAGSLVGKDGFLYIYGKDDINILHEDIIKHAGELGFDTRGTRNSCWFNPAGPGLIFSKEKETPERFPRNYPVIRRESKKYE